MYVYVSICTYTYVYTLVYTSIYQYYPIYQHFSSFYPYLKLCSTYTDLVPDPILVRNRLYFDQKWSQKCPKLVYSYSKTAQFRPVYTVQYFPTIITTLTAISSYLLTFLMYSLAFFLAFFMVSWQPRRPENQQLTLHLNLNFNSLNSKQHCR